MAIIEDIVNIKRGKVDNLIFQGWKTSQVVRAYHGSFRVTHGPKVSFNRSKFGWLMNQYRENKEIVFTLFPPNDGFKFPHSWFISINWSNVQYQNQQFSFIENPFKIMLTETPNASEITKTNNTNPNGMTFTIDNISLRNAVVNGAHVVGGIFLSDGTPVSPLFNPNLSTSVNVSFRHYLFYRQYTFKGWVQFWQYSHTDESLVNYWCKHFS